MNIPTRREDRASSLVTRFSVHDAAPKQDLGPSVATTLRDISRRTVDWLAFGNPLAINGHQYRVIGARRSGEQEFEFVKCQTGEN
ncbi:hypothetical protein [Paraburkholderia atlantica]|uniref:hypothetical protein n=1 Tax=Paraburkholderia atlantica TaxID=2654982 RepID=UPI00160BED36|nr:hypothetical protein [Paraburkholderia atlantica]MBB5421680.1 hypothetical protein [Paraburkholderia atlantica]